MANRIPACLCIVITLLVFAPSVQSEPAKRLNFFHSSHSETDDPFSEYLAAVLRKKGYKVDWNQQIIIGSPISWRIFGGKDQAEFAGYRQGKNKGGATGLDVVRELRKPDRYDILLLAEGNGLIAQVRWNDTHRMLKHFHDRLTEGNPQALTYFIEPWEGFKSKAEPEPWIELTKMSTMVWGCTVKRVNVSLAHEGRPEAIASLPLAAALAYLIERTALNTEPALSAEGREATVSRFFDDDVHLTPLGFYYVALAAFAGLTGEATSGAWAPPGVTAQQAAALQKIVDSFYEDRKKNYTALDLPACRQLMADSFCAKWNDYVPGKWVKKEYDCAEYFTKPESPFHFDPEKDKGIWLPAPPVQ